MPPGWTAPFDVTVRAPLFPSRKGAGRRVVPGALARGLAGADCLGQAGLLAEQVGLVGRLPRRVDVVAAEVAVRRRLLVDRAAQVELLDDRGRAQVEVLLDQLPMISSSTLSVPNVSVMIETGCATPMA